MGCQKSKIFVYGAESSLSFVLEHIFTVLILKKK